MIIEPSSCPHNQSAKCAQVKTDYREKLIGASKMVPRQIKRGIPMTSSILRPFYLLAASLFVFSTLHADQTSFNCEIIAAMDAGGNGNPIPTQLGGTAKFVVDRLSGRIIGTILDNGDFDFEIYGDGRNIVITKTHVAHEFLRIMTFVDSRMKPFVAVDYLGRVYFGLCS